MIKFNHPIFPPSIVTTLTCTYVVPGWVKIPSDTKLSDIKWEKQEISKAILNNKWTFESASSNATYVVEKLGFKFKCSCPGYFRAKDREKGCKHIQQVKSEL